jgi:hypothetical protein
MIHARLDVMCTAPSNLMFGEDTVSFGLSCIKERCVNPFQKWDIFDRVSGLNSEKLKVECITHHSFTFSASHLGLLLHIRQGREDYVNKPIQTKSADGT